MESGNKKDLEWKFDADFTQVASFKELVGLIAMLHVIPNLNKKLGNKEKEFVNTVFNKFYYHVKDLNWTEIIENFKKDTKHSLTTGIYEKAMIYSFQIPFKELSKVMEENNFMWANIFDIIKKLDSYCYINFTDDFFNFEDLNADLKKKLESEKDAFDKFKKGLQESRRAIIRNNRKNWIKKVKLEEKKIIKSWDDLNQILTKVRKYRDNMLFLCTNETEIISNDYQLMRGRAFDFFENCYKYEDNKTFTDIESRKCILKLLFDLGFSFDYEKFDDHIHNRNKWSKNNFQELILSFNRQHWLHECILWFNI